MLRTMRRDIRQLVLLQPTALPSRPFPCWSCSQDEVQICRACGREIIAQRRTVEGLIKEFVSAAGECWNCTRSD